MEKKSFILYNDYINYIEKLTLEERGRLITGIFQKANGQPVQPLEGAADMLFAVISAQMDRDADSYQEVCSRKQAGAQKRWKNRQNALAKESKDASDQDVEDAYAFSQGEFDASDADNDTVTDTDNDNDTGTDTESDPDTAPGTETAPAGGGKGPAGRHTHPKGFRAPTLEEVARYADERCSRVDPQGFLDYYAARGWMAGKSPVVDWKAAFRASEGWERWNKPKERGATYDIDEVERMSVFDVPPELR